MANRSLAAAPQGGLAAAMAKDTLLVSNLGQTMHAASSVHLLHAATACFASGRNRFLQTQVNCIQDPTRRMAA